MNQNVVKLDGDHLTFDQVLNVANDYYAVSIDTAKIQKSKDYIDQKVKDSQIVYGVTTGFGSLVDKPIETAEKAKQLQVNLLRSHACGVGDSFAESIVRAIMVIRLNTLLKGYSGVQQSTVKQLEFMLNHRIHPRIPEQGSVGASGDLCPLSHMALPLIGEGEVEYKLLDESQIKPLSVRVDSEGNSFGTYRTEDFLLSEAAEKMGYEKISLSYKEGLALNNGTTVMAAVGVIALSKAKRLLRIATLSSGLFYESLCARKVFFSFPKVHEIRGHQGQIDVAKWLTVLLDDSKLIDMHQNDVIRFLIENDKIKDEESLVNLNEIIQEEDPGKQKQIPDQVINRLKSLNENEVADMLLFAKKKWKPQDSYSIRCVPQVFGASKVAIEHAEGIVANELNAAVDNPLIFVDDDKVVSAGNFHGQPIALVMDYLKLAVAEIGNIVERQVNKLVDSNTNDGLPSFLINSTGLNSGLMIPQYAAAAIVSENKVLVHPASADSIPTCENTEDHVSMGTISARQALEIANNVERIVSIAIFTAFYAINMRLTKFREVNMDSDPEKLLSKASFRFYQLIKSSNPHFKHEDFLKTDRFLAPEIKNVQDSFELFDMLAEEYLK